MAYAMTKQGSLDNCVTYEFICDAVEDMNAIEDRYRTIGTVAIVLSGESGLEVYIAGSDKQWNSLSSIGANNGSGESETIIIDGGGFSIHICSSSEIRFGKPNISEPDSKTIYLVPASDSSSGNLYDEYIYVNNKWEKFGSGGNIDLSNYVTYQDIEDADLATHNDLNDYASLDDNGKVSMEQLPLPTITSDDNGKILQVGSGEFIVDNLSYNFFEPKTWNGLTDFDGSNIWTDGENIYYSGHLKTYAHYYQHYILDKSTSTWQVKTWYGENEFEGRDIWTDGENIYYSGRPSGVSYSGYQYYILDKSTSTWQDKTWNGFETGGSFSGEYVWTDGENIYLSKEVYSASDPYQYVLDKATSTWSKKIWNGLTNFDKTKIWTDGENYYYSAGSDDQYILDKATSTWNVKIWNGTTDIYGTRVWTDGENIYYTSSSSCYVLDKTTSTWRRKVRQGPDDIWKTSIWTDGENYYYSSGSEQYILQPKEKKILVGTNGEFNSIINVNDFVAEYVPPQVEVANNLATTITGKALDATQGRNLDQNKINKQINNIISKKWTGLTNFRGHYIWTDGENIYYSYNLDQYVLDKSTSRWRSKTWKGLTYFYGIYVWTDGENIYYSDNSTNVLKQYVLDKTTSTWSEKTWNGLTNFSGDSTLWTDGDNIYYSSGSSQYILDKTTSTWSIKTWNRLTNPYGSYIWTDGENIYYSYNSDQYILDKSTSTWQNKTWKGLTKFDGYNIWTDGENIYYSYSTQHYILDKSTSTWLAKTWSLNSLSASDIWTDGDNIYFSNNSNQYEIITDDIILLASNGTFEPTSVKKLTKTLMQEFPRIPEAPSTDGTYILQATVTNGTPTYSWISAG